MSVELAEEVGLEGVLGQVEVEAVEECSCLVLDATGHR